MKISPLLIAFALMSASLTVRAGEIELAWDPVPGATGYRVYYGTTPGSYAASLTTSSTSATISGLPDCTSHYVAVKGLNGAGESEQYSNEVSGWPRPSVSSAGPAAVKQGNQAVIDITGTNFQSGADVELGDPQIVVGSVSVLSCTRIQVLTTVEPTAANVRPAQVGKHDVTVVNSDNVYGVGVEDFEVLINPYRFDINRSDSATTNRIDGKDTIYLSRQFGLSASNPAYDPDNDFDGDGWVDGTDLAYIASNLGRCWSASSSSWSSSACPASLQ